MGEILTIGNIFFGGGGWQGCDGVGQSRDRGNSPTKENPKHCCCLENSTPNLSVQSISINQLTNII